MTPYYSYIIKTLKNTNTNTCPETFQSGGVRVPTCTKCWILSNSMPYIVPAVSEILLHQVTCAFMRKRLGEARIEKTSIFRRSWDDDFRKRGKRFDRMVAAKRVAPLPFSQVFRAITIVGLLASLASLNKRVSTERLVLFGGALNFEFQYRCRRGLLAIREGWFGFTACAARCHFRLIPATFEHLFVYVYRYIVFSFLVEIRRNVINKVDRVLRIIFARNLRMRRNIKYSK